MRCKSSKHSLNLMQTPPPPRFAWSPSPAFAGADDFNRSRGAAERPSYGTPLSEVVTTGLDPVVHAEATRPNAGGSACASEASAWMPGIGERSDAVLRTAMPGHDEEKNGRTKKIRRRNADRRKALLPCVRHGRAWSARRTTVGVPPRFSPQGVFHRKGLSLRPGFLGRGLCCTRR